MNPKFQDLAFDAVIPCALLFNENLEPSAIKLYAFVRGLAHVHGYCYATNAYLAECMNCAESTITRLLSSLAEEKFIEIETNKEGIHWQRHIFLGVNLKESLRRFKNDDPHYRNQRPPSGKMSTNKGYSIRDIEKEEECRPSASSPSPEAQEVSNLLMQAIKKTKPDIKEPKSLKTWDAEVDRMLRIDKRNLETVKKLLEWLPTSSFWSKVILSAEKFRLQFDKLELAMSETPPRTALNDLGLIECLKTCKDLISRRELILGGDYVEFPRVHGENYFKAGQPGFKENIESRLRKMNVIPPWLQKKT